MGGKLYNLGRLPQASYVLLEQKIRAYLEQKMPLAYRIPRYYASKADFGDMDVLIAPQLAGKESNALRDEIIADLGITQWKSMGNGFSTVFEGLQVDFFVLGAEHLESTYNYLSFNDLGNLIGRICKRFNLKYGEQGLLYVYRRQEGQYQTDLPITTDFRRICAFLGLAYGDWERGFDSLAQMFEWVIASPYFSVEPYLNTHAIDKRAKNRPTVERFLAYLAENRIEKRFEFAEKDAYLPAVADFFPEARLLEQIAEEQEREQIAAQISAKFNGRVLMELLPSLVGRELGKFINDFKATFGDEKGFETYLLEASQEEINQRILTFYAGAK